MEVIIYQVDAFTDKPYGGNPAGVVPDANGLTEEDMQKIANEMNLSETAFVFAYKDNEFNVRYFTPKCEVDLCGHATIAAFYTLAHKGYIKGVDDGVVKVFQHTKLGKLPVEIYYTNQEVDKILMYQGQPKSLGYIQHLDNLYTALNIEKEYVGLENYELKPELVSTGLPDIILPVKTRDILENLDINYDEISNFTKEAGAIGIHVFTMSNNESIWCRNFAPLVGIKEEAATGTANGALIYYLKKNNVIKDNKILVHQGQSLGRPSDIYCEIVEKGHDNIVKVGGKATIIMEGVITI